MLGFSVSTIVGSNKVDGANTSGCNRVDGASTFDDSNASGSSSAGWIVSISLSECLTY